MTRLLILFVCVALVYSCQKNIDATGKKGAAVVSDNALAPLKYHATSFVTNHPIVKGQVPPFSFEKTMYADTRVKTLHMIDKADIDYPSQYGVDYSYDFNYQFSYGVGKAIITRAFKVYGKPQTVPTQQFECLFNSYGYVTSIKLIGVDNDNGVDRLIIDYKGNRMSHIATQFSAFIQNPKEPFHRFWGGGGLDVTYDANGNITNINGGSLGYGGILNLSYTYNTKSTGKTLLYQPTQYLINQWFTLCEVMQWIPMQANERTSVAFTFSDLNFNGGSANAYRFDINQGQKYLNNKYDVNGNLISYTYGDNVPQKIIWK